MPDLFERRSAAIAWAGAQARRYFHRMNEPHAEHAGVEVYGHLHVVGVQRQVMHAVEAHRRLRLWARAVSEDDIRHRVPPGAARARSAANAAFSAEYQRVPPRQITPKPHIWHDLSRRNAL